MLTGIGAHGLQYETINVVRIIKEVQRQTADKETLGVRRDSRETNTEGKYQGSEKTRLIVKLS